MSVLALLLAYVPVALFRGWVISLLWSWYVTDYFALPRLTVVEAVGLGILATLFTSYRDDDRSAFEAILAALLVPALGLVFGWAWTFVR